MDRRADRIDQDRRGFLATALLIGGGLVGGGLIGCEPPASSGRTRRLPPASGLGGDRVQVPEPSPAKPASVIVVDRPVPPSSEPTVRVRIAAVRPPTRRIRIDGDGPRVFIGSPDGVAKPVATPAEIEPTMDGWVVIESVGTRNAGTYQFPAQPLAIRAAPGSKGVRFANALVGNLSWPFELRCTHRTDEGIGAVDIVCHVGMESYLPGVLAKELYPNWSREAFLAQSVAARSYALCEMAQNTDRHFDVVAGEASQAWVGATTHRTSLDAARGTAGMVLVWEGLVVPAYYSSTCGGRPANATEAIAPGAFNAIPPLIVKASSSRECCRGAPAWRWRISLPTAETAKRVALWAKTERPAMARIDGLRSIEPNVLNASGRPVSFRLTDARNQVFEMPAERLRWAFNSDQPGLPDVRSRVKSADFSAQVSAVSVTLDGRGFGHGVGMCQYGAEAMSKSGSTWRDILRLYYPGAEVTQAYGHSLG